MLVMMNECLTWPVVLYFAFLFLRNCFTITNELVVPVKSVLDMNPHVLFVDGTWNEPSHNGCQSIAPTHWPAWKSSTKTPEIDFSIATVQLHLLWMSRRNCYYSIQLKISCKETGTLVHCKQLTEEGGFPSRKYDVSWQERHDTCQQSWCYY